jgi:hypothetical protein
LATTGLGFTSFGALEPQNGVKDSFFISGAGLAGTTGVGFVSCFTTAGVEVDFWAQGLTTDPAKGFFTSTVGLATTSAALATTGLGFTSFGALEPQNGLKDSFFISGAGLAGTAGVGFVSCFTTAGVEVDFWAQGLTTDPAKGFFTSTVGLATGYGFFTSTALATAGLGFASFGALEPQNGVKDSFLISGLATGSGFFASTALATTGVGFVSCFTTTGAGFFTSAALATTGLGFFISTVACLIGAAFTGEAFEAIASLTSSSFLKSGIDIDGSGISGNDNSGTLIADVTFLVTSDLTDSTLLLAVLTSLDGNFCILSTKSSAAS